MRKSVLIFGAFGLILVLHEAAGTLMLGSLLMALKGGMFAGKMGLGGLLAMALAGTQNQEGIATTGGVYGRKRATRSVTSISETPLELKEPPNGTHLSAEKLADSLNNLTLPSTRRMMRQVAILDQLSCLPKVLCGLNTRTPSTKTSVINDYGYLIKFLFERDSDDADQEDEEEQDEEDDDDQRDDEEDDDTLSRAEASVTKKTKKKANKDSKNDEEDYDSKEDDITVDDQEFDKLADDDDQLEQQAQDELLETEPEMLAYILTEMRQKMKGQGRNGYIGKGAADHTRDYAIGSPYHTGGYPTYQPDHTYLPGYNKPSYYNHPATKPALNTDSATAILNERPYLSTSNAYSSLKGNGFKFGSPKFEFKIGANDNPSNSKGGFLSSLLPSFSFTTVKGSKGSKDKDDPFADDPFFAGFKRRRNLRLFKQVSGESKDTGKKKSASGRTLSLPRINSKFKPVDTTFVDLKREQLLTSNDPIEKYKVAAEVGQKTKSARQCRMLFAKCPYEYSEIMSMIENLKKLVNTNAQVGDKEVKLKQPATPANSGTISASGVTATLPAQATLASDGSGKLVNVKSGGAANSGVTSISHQLDSGDKVEIMLKFQPKEENNQVQPVFQILPATIDKSSSNDLVNATQSLLEMRKAIQAIQAINRLYNQTDLQYVGLQNQNHKTTNTPEPVVSTQKPETTTSIAQRIISLTGTISEPSAGFAKKKAATDALAAHSESVESDSGSKSSEEVAPKRRNGIQTKVPNKKPVEVDDDSSSREEDDEEDDDDDDDEDEDDEEAEVVRDDPEAASRAQYTFQGLAKPPVPMGPPGPGEYEGHMYENGQPIVTSFHFGGQPKTGLDYSRLPNGPSGGQKRPGPLPPKPSRYKIVRSKSKQRFRNETPDSTRRPQVKKSTTRRPQTESSGTTKQPRTASTARMNQLQTESTARTKPPQTSARTKQPQRESTARTKTPQTSARTEQPQNESTARTKRPKIMNAPVQDIE